MRVLRRFAIASLLAACAAGAGAQESTYPRKPVRIITAGAGTFHDIVTRQLGQRLSERWGQPVVVENQPGAALTIGTGIAARATPDGYTLLMSDRSALTVAQHLYKTLQYDVARDFSPLTLTARTPSVLVAHPSVPAATLREFVEHAKRQPGEIQIGAGGVGTASHIANELLKQLTGINLVNVHYKGGGPQMLAILSGEVKAGSGLVANVLPHVRAGKMKAYVVTSKERFAGAPDIPSAPEAGLPGLESEFWLGMLAPARTPVALSGRLNREMVELLQSPEMRAVLLAQGAEVASGSPEQFAAFIKSETLKWGKVIKTAGIKPE
ncbi:MAG: Bug family tripartite tricarboxylate transporter substrate binding protein [Burkholderiales bacterium]